MATQTSSPLTYLLELRSRLLRCGIVFSVIALVLMPFANQLYPILAKPLLRLLPAGHSLIVTALAAAFFIPLKLALWVALILTIPYLLYELWRFVTPALYVSEQRWLWLLVFSLVMFYLGMLFAYVVVFPLLFRFFIQTAPVGVAIWPDIGSYFSLSMQLLVVFGSAFEVPIIIVVLVATGITTLEKLKSKRRYYIVLAFIVAMFLTPPDVVSQSLLAVPLCLLFELGLVLSRLLLGKKLPNQPTAENEL